jgi:hypothetical protein
MGEAFAGNQRRQAGVISSRSVADARPGVGAMHVPDAASRLARFAEEIAYYPWHRQLSGQGLALSREALIFEGSELLSRGTLMTLRLRLPGSGRAFTILARVSAVWPDRLMRVEFLDIAPGDRDRVEAFVAGEPAFSAVERLAAPADDGLRAAAR